MFQSFEPLQVSLKRVYLLKYLKQLKLFHWINPSNYRNQTTAHRKSYFMIIECVPSDLFLLIFCTANNYFKFVCNVGGFFFSFFFFWSFNTFISLHLRSHSQYMKIQVEVTLSSSYIIIWNKEQIKYLRIPFAWMNNYSGLGNFLKNEICIYFILNISNWDKMKF